jgi:23S rRNA (uracil1939-C5)-methyltransferase
MGIDKNFENIEKMTNHLYIESLDLDAQGVAHREDGKVVFVDGALPFEIVSAQIHRKKEAFEKGTLTQIHRESSQRVRPGCPHFGLQPNACGGCKVQHLHASAQVAVKQRSLEDSIAHIGKAKPQAMLRPIEGPAWGYRYRARLSVKYVIKKGEVLIGFHERKSRYVADIKSCAVLAPQLGRLLLPLRALISSMAARQTIPQIEVACGDSIDPSHGVGVTALVLRHMEDLSDGDQAKLREFAVQHQALSRVQWWLQSGGPDTVRLLDEISPAQAAQAAQSELSYTLPEFGVTMPYRPTDFTQVNPHINRVLVSRSLRLLAVQPTERVIDWFCGLGNFTLPLATQAKEVLGIEGSEALVQRATDNFARFKASRLLTNASTPSSMLTANTSFVARNLFNMTAEMLMADGVAQKWLVDPPREGAFALAKALADAILEMAATQSDRWTPPQRIVYVSCNPATLARDVDVLVNTAGYRLVSAGVVNMFPHTAHVESMAVFERD